jgi:hypothetical protein
MNAVCCLLFAVCCLRMVDIGWANSQSKKAKQDAVGAHVASIHVYLDETSLAVSNRASSNA